MILRLSTCEKIHRSSFPRQHDITGLFPERESCNIAVKAQPALITYFMFGGLLNSPKLQKKKRLQHLTHNEL